MEEKLALTKCRKRLQGYHAQGETYEGLDLRSMSAYASEWINCRFERCKMDLSDFSQRTRFINCVFYKTEIRATTFIGASFENTSFLGCDLEQSVFINAVLKTTRFDTCRMSYSSFKDATLSQCEFWSCNLHGSDLDFIDAKKTGFDNCNLWGVRLSVGCQFFNASIDEKTLNRFVAMIARIHPDPQSKTRLLDVCHEEYPAVDRAMRGHDDSEISALPSETEALRDEADGGRTERTLDLGITHAGVCT